MRPRYLLCTAFLIVAPVAAGWHASHTPIGKDEIRHLSYLRSLVFDRDLDFTNDYRLLWDKFRRRPWYVERTGRPPNESPIGPALLWLPAYLLLVGSGIDPSGVGLITRALLAAISSAAFSAGILATWATVRRLTSHALLTVGCVVLASHYVYWWLFPGLYGHALAAGTCGLYFWFWRRTLDRDDARSWALLGAISGLVAMVRWQNLLLPLLGAGWKILRRGRLRPAAIAWFAVPLLLCLLPQVMAWQAVYGVPLLIPQGRFMHWDKPYLLDTLFSPRYGLLGFSPFLYLSVLGLVVGARQARRPLVGLAVLYFLVAWYVNASAGDWYGGATFGPRRMDSLFPVLAIGAALAIESGIRLVCTRPQVPFALLGLALTSYTAVLAGAYEREEINVGMVGADRFPQSASQLLLERVGWLPSAPAEAFHRLVSGTRWGQYSAIAGAEPISWRDGTWRPEARFLGPGWRLDRHGAAHLEAERGRLFVYLMDLGYRYRDLDVTVIARCRGPARGDSCSDVSLALNGRPVAVVLGRGQGGTIRVRAHLPYERLRPGINAIDLGAPALVLKQLRLAAGLP